MLPKDKVNSRIALAELVVKTFLIPFTYFSGVVGGWGQTRPNSRLRNI